MAISSSTETKEQIQNALAAFASEPLPQAARALFDKLGYNSQRDERVLKINTPADFIGWVKSASLSNAPSEKEQQELTDSCNSLHFLFQLTDVEVGAALGQSQADLFDSHTTVDGSRYESYLFFTAELADSSTQSRTAMARLTRLINKPLPMPAMILFRQGETVTLAVINRRLHKSNASRDVLEKVTLIKDIAIAKPHRAHLEILHDMSVASLKKVEGITSFVTLHNAWQKALDTSALNRRFYREIADWYFWAVKEVQFPLPPTNKLAADPTNNSICVIRLLTRLIFTWFLKEKGLVPDSLFDEKELQKILVGASPCGCPSLDLGDNSDKGDRKGTPLHNNSTYYRAILQNLFFATLNAEMNRDVPGNRRFVQAESGGYGAQKSEYGIKNIFRYADLFAISKEEAVKLFDDIPFLNGGLFDCLDKEDDNGKVIYLDGFTRNPRLQPVVPDYLFFSDYRTIDLSGDYGDKKRSQKKVRGLIRILRDYKFTVAENTPIEEEVALDPELLGNVFENLLASYNPETGVTARKLTGSFYTPRMIVNYMVDESLKAYLEGKLVVVFAPPHTEGKCADISKNVLDFPPPLQGEGRGGDGVDCMISASYQKQPHPHPNLPLEGEGTLKAGECHSPLQQNFITATFTDPEQLANLNDAIADIAFTMPVSALSPDGWSLERPDVLNLMTKLRQGGKPLGDYVGGKIFYGIKTGLNEAFVIDGATRKRLIEEEPKSAEVIKPWLRGRDIKKWQAEWAGLYGIFTRRGTDIEKYPTVKKHLEQFREDLEPKKKETDRRGRKPGSYKWFEIQDNIAYFEEFEKEKILWPGITSEIVFGLGDKGQFGNDNNQLIISSDRCLLAILNSRLIRYVLQQICDKVRGGFYRMKMIYVEQLPIPDVPPEKQAPIVALVEQILAAKKKQTSEVFKTSEVSTPTDIPALEAEIDRLVYALYNLTDEEIALVEGKK